MAMSIIVPIVGVAIIIVGVVGSMYWYGRKLREMRAKEGGAD